MKFHEILIGKVEKNLIKKNIQNFKEKNWISTKNNQCDSIFKVLGSNLNKSRRILVKKSQVIENSVFHSLLLFSRLIVNVVILTLAWAKKKLLILLEKIKYKMLTVENTETTLLKKYSHKTFIDYTFPNVQTVRI